MQFLTLRPCQNFSCLFSFIYSIFILFTDLITQHGDFMAAINPVQPAVAANVPELQPGLLNLNELEVEVLKTACARKHSEKGSAIETLLSVATLIAGIWAGLTVGGTGGFFLACAVILIGGNALSSIYNSIRNRAYLDASSALDKRDFQQFIVNRHLDFSVDSIVDVHNAYKKYLSNQVAGLRRDLA
jgi:hypothetical protein